MAKAPTPNERTEREFQTDVNQAVANTEGEIFEDALGDEPLENDGDTSLEEMGDGLEGDDLEDEEGDDKEAGEEEAEEAEGEGEEEAEGEEAEAAEDDEEDQPRDERGRFEDRQPDQRGVPPGRLREESDRRRQAEERVAALEREVAEMRGRVEEQSRRPPQQVVEQPRPPVPDMFADPEGYNRHVREEVRRETEALLEQRLMREAEARVNDNLNRYANSEEGRRFDVAYKALLAIAPRNQALVQRVWRSHDPGREILDWFKDNGGSEFDEQDRERVTKEAIKYGLLPEERSQNNSRQRSQQPRHETRLPESLRRTGPPSLNSARGGQRQEVQDPDMMDDSDDAVMRYAMRR